MAQNLKKKGFRNGPLSQAENDVHVKGDRRWFVEILCQNGLIYPCGGLFLLAYAKGGVKARIQALGEDIRHHQTDGNADVFKFSVEHLDEIAAILKPRKRRAVGANPEQLRAMRERRKLLVRGGQTAQETTPNQNKRRLPLPL
jgi:hypothetical protein